MSTQATKWTAQLTDGTKLRGGQSNLYPDDLNVSAVPVSQIKVFTIAHNTFSDTYYKALDTWYHNGVPVAANYPRDYIMGDGSLLTVDINVNGLLALTQV